MTSYTLETKLENDTRYYWKIIPDGGVCLSEPFCFTVNLSYKTNYNVNLTSEKDFIMLCPGSKTEINLTVRNEGILDDRYEIEYNSDTLQKYTYIDRILIQLSSDAESVLKLTIMIPENFELGVYSVSITASSLNDMTVSDKIAVIVEVVKNDIIPKYGVSISVSPALIELDQGESANVTLNIMNFGNIADKYSVSFISDVFSSNNIFLERNSVSLNESEIKSLIVQIFVSENTEVGTYNITFLVQSEHTANETILTVNVKTKATPSEPTQGRDNTLTFIIAGIIILIIILILLILLRKRLKRSGQSTAPALQFNIEPDEPPAPETVAIIPESSDKPNSPELREQPSVRPVDSGAPVPASTPVPTPELEPESAPASASTPTNQSIK
jgi:uncharacterized membrane protein